MKYNGMFLHYPGSPQWSDINMSGIKSTPWTCQDSGTVPPRAMKPGVLPVGKLHPANSLAEFVYFFSRNNKLLPAHERFP